MKSVLITIALGAAVGASIGIAEQIFRAFVRREVSNLSDDAVTESPA